jgi:hypothetical protein
MSDYLSKISWKAVITGGIVDIVATNVFVFPLIVYVMVTHNLVETSAENSSVVLDYIQADLGLHFLALILGSSASVLGGYVAARMAKHDILLNAALASFICVIGIIAGFALGSVTLLLFLLYLVLNPLLTMFGGYILLWQKSQLSNVR